MHEDLFEKEEQSNFPSSQVCYWQHYHWYQDPFSSVRDDNMTLMLSEWENHLDILQHVVHNENALIAVIGEQGSGKTTFLQLLLAQAGNSIHIHHINGEAGFTPEKIAETLARGFRLQIYPAEYVEEQLDALIAEIQYTDLPCLLAIDDANVLSKESLQALFYLVRQQSNTQMRLHILLLGSQQLQANLAELARQELGSEIIHSIELSPLSLAETKQYLQHRLSLVGHSGALPFDDLVTEHIYQLSGGLPERINHVAQQMLTENIHRQKKIGVVTIMQKLQNKLIGAVVVAFVFVGILWALDRKESKTDANAPVLAFAGAKQEVPLTLEQTPDLKKEDNPPASENIKTASPEIASIADKSGVAQAAPSAIVAESTAVDPAATPAIVPDIAKNNAISTPNGLDNEQRGNVDEKALQASLAAEANPGTAKPTTSSAPQVVSKKVKTSRVKPNKSYTANSSELLNVQNHYYTLQILALSHETGVQNFLKHEKNEKLFFYKTQSMGKPKYVLLYGKYPTRAAAEAAKQNLPESLKQYTPWVRSYASVKTDLQKTKVTKDKV